MSKGKTRIFINAFICQISMVYLLCAKIVLCGDDRVANKVFSSSEKHTLQLGYVNLERT